MDTPTELVSPFYRSLNGFVVDAETTGLDAKRCSLIDLGCVDLATGDEFFGECRVFDGALIEPEALKVNGATEERLHNPLLQSEAELIKAFSAWVKARSTKSRGLLAGQNPALDRDFVQAERAGWFSGQ